jgi:hypothetical protein
MSLTGDFQLNEFPRTTALRRALAGQHNEQVKRDLLFLERWEARPTFAVAETLRARQIRRAQPALANAIRAELATSGMEDAPPLF